MRTVIPTLAAAAAVLLGLLLLVRWLEPRMAFFPFAGETETPQAFGLPFEPLTIQTSDGERLRAWRLRPALPRAHVLYFHGNGGNLSNWAPILVRIVRHGYAITAIDYRGYGLSTGRPSERGLYRDVEAVVAATAGDSHPVVYWGRSLGAAMAAYAATLRKPDGLILEAGFPDVRTVVRDSPVLHALSWLSSYRFPTADLVNRAGVPVLQMHGDRDTVIAFRVGQELFDRITVPKQFFVIAGGDHNDEAPRDEAAYWSAIDRFVDGLPRPR